MLTAKKAGWFLVSHLLKLAIVNVECWVLLHVCVSPKYHVSWSFKPPLLWVEVVYDFQGSVYNVICQVQVAFPFGFGSAEFCAWWACRDNVKVPGGVGGFVVPL